MSPKPTILLVPGSFSPPPFYESIPNSTSSKGYEIHTLHLPTIGKKDGKPPTMADDAAFINAAAAKIVDEGKDIVVVARSYGGVCASEGAKGLPKAERGKEGKKERKKERKKGGIVRIAYITALAPAVGVSTSGVLADAPNAEIVFSDLPPAEGQAWARKFSHHSRISFAGQSTYPVYKYILLIPPSAQQLGIEFVERESGKKVDVTRIDTGHRPNASAPGKVVDWIVGVVEKA
ncbi:hypothetical protein K469DRAFT_741099 [Zopfia rhizophila CBS 207.26]|uniref:AB hydrolase-1 domain-containing protein n=1 Tax=Zopfia rhizophila CBS 207.26 TaxID=1314779 RepID=A0A6A6DNK7_9PEZI|nr:hypothetical protein K469DRAFT_741099 [Zopfia rhizophila CBS 207.26]